MRRHTHFSLLPPFLLTTVGLAIAFGGAVFFYYSRAIPTPLGDDEVTSLPPELKNILGATSEVPSLTFKVPIFLYHYIEYVRDRRDTIRISLNIPPHILQQQIETLKQAGYTFITAYELGQAIAGSGQLPEKPIMLTFDDGYLDFYTDAYPILKKENVEAVAYIVPNFLNRPNYMFSWQVQQIAREKLVEIGAHTLDHKWLPALSEAAAWRQIVESRIVLQNLIHAPVYSFAYPYGAFNQRTMQFVEDAGFTTGLTTVPGISQSPTNKYFLYRLRPGWLTGQALLRWLRQENLTGR